MQPQPKKRLGQNFLFDKNIQAKIIAACRLHPTDTVLEIGAGRGELTGTLSGKVKRVFCVEIDPRLCRLLEASFKGHPNIKILQRDILKLDIERLVKAQRDKIKVIGNIPYYITSPIIARLFQYRKYISGIYLLVQKEFARRIIAQAGSVDYGAFSIFAQYYATPKILFTVKKGSFWPQPKVDSAFIDLQLKEKLPLGPKDERVFFKVVRAAFAQRRKQLKNSLRGVLPQALLQRYFQRSGVAGDIRAERLSAEDFMALLDS
jgi:16S rRNA (adenine1518-N6/adenine1519-N6)-dimethyltransferase